MFCKLSGRAIIGLASASSAFPMMFFGVGFNRSSNSRDQTRSQGQSRRPRPARPCRDCRRTFFQQVANQLSGRAVHKRRPHVATSHFVVSGSRVMRGGRLRGVVPGRRRLRSEMPRWLHSTFRLLGFTPNCAAISKWVSPCAIRPGMAAYISSVTRHFLICCSFCGFLSTPKRHSLGALTLHGANQGINVSKCDVPKCRTPRNNAQHRTAEIGLDRAGDLQQFARGLLWIRW